MDFLAATLSIIVITNNGGPVSLSSWERKETNVIKILTTYTMFNKYEQKPNTINKWVGLQVPGLLSIPLPNLTDGDGELMKLGRNKSIIIQIQTK